ncbi:hypothetical protein A6046_03685 [[Haemophilus] ducreyi]|uniref:Fe-S metabolism associated domain-containing protein n=1 Tax=Haemophilus ducreyi TaxID=730 RepID=A0AAC8UDQ0_HAEDC|nr:SufE family protein [[Haemophilus] ducreyi]AKO31571.1 hypothetical protein RY60_00835 [[Haemophilus] ducreyi]AKO33031.1 hypothetical protein RZ57_00840 [[Haemophilus] ducreyi]AKO34479.1 hypothetical protein RZ58_00840 [[Haemophilus] ducreyi]AKO35917.1 hypothetical protein RZ59_00835 [[Haemophilus] ducreyi]AKO37374.1 hypothetical protein RZ61_00830 [[Haemophilus] ducreyi]
MTVAEIYQKFELCKTWEDRYRLLVQLSRLLVKPTAEQLANLPEIHGCESRLWFQFQAEPRQVIAYSDARLMQGILVIIVAVLTEKSSQELKEFSLTNMFQALHISQSLTQTRLNGLARIQQLYLSALVD